MNAVEIFIRFLIIGVLYFSPDIFIMSGLKSLFINNAKKVRRRYVHISISVFILIMLLFAISGYLPASLNRAFSYLSGVFAGILLFKLCMAIVLLLQDVVRIPMSLINPPEHNNSKKRIPLHSRRKFIVQASVLFGSVPFAGMIYGMIRGRYRFTVHKETIYYENLPAAFDGVSITQFSDLHIGSWNLSEKHHLVEFKELLQSLQTDILFFTGDIVNSRADEMDGWFEVFQSLQAPLGKFSILGNHDYGDYVHWKTEEDKAANLEQVKAIHPQLGFDLLLNENRVIEKDGEKLFLMGVENWGMGDFPKFGDIKKASADIPSNGFKILLSHDPSHWDAKILEEEFPPQLTLSGHTHGFQMGIETPAFRFSPSQWVYEQWAGLYEKKGVYIYVNRGVGTVGYPGRIGIWPEITQITLRKK